MTHPVIALVRFLVTRPGWIFLGLSDPPPTPPGFTLETKDDGFLGYVTHYRFVPEVKP